ncbi:hypothetical protein E2I00_012105, partial [Balaenoptera physalus]
ARMGVFAQADGSAYIEQGNTKALAVVYGPHEATGFVDGTALADLSHVEEAAGGPQLALALLPSSGQIALLEMDARLHEDHLEQVLEAAAHAARD